jgi:hypothetical protein
VEASGSSAPPPRPVPPPTPLMLLQSARFDAEDGDGDGDGDGDDGDDDDDDDDGGGGGGSGGPAPHSCPRRRHCAQPRRMPPCDEEEEEEEEASCGGGCTLSSDREGVWPRPWRLPQYFLTRTDVAQVNLSQNGRQKGRNTAAAPRAPPARTACESRPHRPSPTGTCSVRTLVHLPRPRVDDRQHHPLGTAVSRQISPRERAAGARAGQRSRT